MITSTSNRSIAWIAACLLPFAATTAFAATQRTFVKSIGIDNPTCALNAPCRTLGAAIAATSPGGEVIVLDSAGYGAVTIFQSVSIIAPPGIYAGISVATGTGITVNNPNAKVILEGLTINGTGGDSGIRLPQGELHVNRCSVANMLLDGISSNPIGPARLFVHDSVIRDNGGVGIKLSKTVIAVIERNRSGPKYVVVGDEQRDVIERRIRTRSQRLVCDQPVDKGNRRQLHRQ